MPFQSSICSTIQHPCPINDMKYICIALIRFYRRFLSPLKGSPSCRFTPTCSAYALEAFEKRGFFVGIYLTVTRIARCQPFCAGGHDPVPMRGLANKRVKWRPKVKDDGGRMAFFKFLNYELPYKVPQKKSKNKK